MTELERIEIELSILREVIKSPDVPNLKNLLGYIEKKLQQDISSVVQNQT